VRNPRQDVTIVYQQHTRDVLKLSSKEALILLYRQAPFFQGSLIFDVTFICEQNEISSKIPCDIDSCSVMQAEK
jgi:hypothetical protein